MGQISRVHSFNDAVRLRASELESEIANIVNIWNATNRGVLKWEAVSIAYGGYLRFTSSSGALTTNIKYTINQFQIIPDATNGLQIDGNVAFGGQAPSYGSGDDVLFVSNAATAPTADPTAGNIFYCVEGSLKARGSDGGHVVLAPKGITSVVNADSPYTVLRSDMYVLADATAGAITVTLPAATGNEARVIHVKKIDVSANAVTVARAGSDTIEGATTYALPAQFNSITVYSNGSAAWFIQSAT